jgi:ribose/xylose/arabinose/galactoside ABC-type transport system permease subunit
MSSDSNPTAQPVLSRNDENRGHIGRFSALVRREWIWLVLLAVMALLATISSNFLTTGNLLNILRQVSIVGIVAIGVVVVLIAGNFDLSVGAILTLAAVVSVQMQPTDPPRTLLSIIAPLVLGIIVGAANGAIIGLLRANSIIVTVGMQFIITGCVLLYVAGQHVRVDQATPFYFALSGGYLLGVPVPVYLFLLVTAVCHFLMTRTLFGRYVRAIGGNAEAARLVGMPVARYVLFAYLISGAAASVSGIILASRVRNLDPTVGIGYEFSALTAVVLGGARLSGGQGSILHTFAGVLILGVVANGMRLFNLPFNTQLLVQGIILVAAVALGASGKVGER